VSARLQPALSSFTYRLLLRPWGTIPPMCVFCALLCSRQLVAKVLLFITVTTLSLSLSLANVFSGVFVFIIIIIIMTTKPKKCTYSNVRPAAASRLIIATLID